MLPAHPIESLRYLPIGAIAAVLAAGAWVVLSGVRGTATSISEQLSNNRRQFIVMGLSLTLFGLVFYGSTFGWLAPTYHLGVSFYVLLSVAYIAQLAVAWTPYVGKSVLHTQIHTRGGEFVACAMLICLGMVFARNFHQLPGVSFWLCLVTIVFSVTAVVLYIVSPRVHRQMVVYESVYVVLFAACVAALTFKV